MDIYFSSLLTVLQPFNLVMLYLCSVVGIILGAIPGLAGGMGITLILPITFALNRDLSFCMLLGMYVGGVSGAFVSSILVGIPGSASAIATCYDGYPMTQNGQAGKALTIGILGSFIGTVISVLVAAGLSGIIADFALKLGPWEYFSLCFMAISLIVGMGHGSLYKGLLSAFLGIWISTIGTDRVTNAMRFTFNDYHLYGGISVVALLMGVFAVQQVVTSFAKGNLEMPEIDASNLKGLGISVKEILKEIKTIIVSFFIGLWVGFLPGMGGGVAGMVSYGQAKKMSKHPEKFGTGVQAGVWASEVANNASIGGALIPMISLGIPGDGTTLMLLSAMTIHGLQAGPMFITRNPDLAYLIFAAVLLSAILVVVTELLTKRWFPSLLKAPYHYMYSTILLFCFVGAFSATTSIFGIFQMLVFGVLGVLLEFGGIPMGPMMLAYVLGGNLEAYFRQGLSYSRGDYTSFFTRPVSAIFLIIGIYSLFSPLVKHLIKRIKDSKKLVLEVAK